MNKKCFKKINLERILEYGIYLLVFLLPFQTRYFLSEEYLGGAFWEYGSVSIYVFDILLLMVFCLSVYRYFISKKPLKIDKFWYFLATFEVFVFISIFFSSNWQISLYGYFKVLLAFAFFYLIAYENFDYNKLMISLFSSVFFQSVLGITQRVINFSPGNKYLGLAEHNPVVLGTYVVELEDNTRLLRSYGGLDHPNIYGVFVFVGIYFFVKYLLTQKNEKFLSYRKILFNYSFLTLLLFSLFLSFSRLSYLLLIIFFIFLFFWSFYDKKRRPLILKILSFMCVVFVLWLPFNYKYLSQRVNLESRLENISNNERLDQAGESLSIIKGNEFFGVGVGNYTNYLSERDNPIKESWKYQPVHNVYMLVFAEIGVFGLLSFLSLIVFLIYLSIVKKMFFDVFLIFSLLSSFLFDHWFWSLHFGLIFIFFLFALIYRRLST